MKCAMCGAVLIGNTHYFRGGEPVCSQACAVVDNESFQSAEAFKRAEEKEGK